MNTSQNGLNLRSGLHLPKPLTAHPQDIVKTGCEYVRRDGIQHAQVVNAVVIVYENASQETEEFLSDVNIPPGCHWLQMASSREVAIHYVLSQLIYRPDSSAGEAPYDLPDPDDLVKLLWCDRKAVGFYSVKPLGPRSQMSNDLEGSGMPTLDTAFILPSHRKQGFGLSMLHDLVKNHPNTNVGFSNPISKAMWKVLKKFLELNEELKRKFWLIKGDCDEGNKTLIWLCLRNIHLQDSE